MKGTLVHRAAPGFASSRSPAWRRWTAVLLCGVLSLNACYSTKPVTGIPTAASRVVLDLNDQGRLAYGERIGSSVRHVEGVVESATDSALVIRIAAVRYLDGKTHKWSGERFRFGTAHVSRVQQRDFSRSRTALVVAGSAAAVAALVAVVKLVGNSQGGTRGEPPGNGGTGSQ